LVDDGQFLDTTPLKEKGIQHVRSFFSEETRRDFAKRAEQIVAMREAGTLTYDSQDSQGLDHDWYEPLIHNEDLIRIATSVLGPDVCAAGWRILVKDKHYQKAVQIHQDWPYNKGDTRKLSMFLCLTPMSLANGGLIFLEESHFYGPQSMGPLDPSRYPAMDELCPDVEVGDLLLCDFLTWHYSLPPENDEERIMVQLNYQPASDASGSYLVAGKAPHNRLNLTRSRLDASSVPSVDLNAKAARRYWENGDLDRAGRYTRGLLFDDPDHAGAALLMCEILAADKDPSALSYLEKARIATRKLQVQIAALEQRFGLEPGPIEIIDEDMAAAPIASDRTSPWRPLGLSFYSQVADRPNSTAFPATLATPQEGWGYGAISDLIQTAGPATIRVRAKALDGKIGLCLISEDCSTLVSEQHVITPETGDSAVMIAFAADKSPARILLRNFDDAGNGGEVVVGGIDILEYA
jgi:hypothetical protein